VGLDHPIPFHLLQIRSYSSSSSATSEILIPHAHNTYSTAVVLLYCKLRKLIKFLQ
jgi:hypothetical protein